MSTARRVETKHRPRLAPAMILLAVVGGCCLVTGLYFIADGAVHTVHPRPGRDPDTGITGVLIGALGCLLPSLVMLVVSARSMLLSRRMGRLVGLAETHARLPIDVVARELNVSPGAARSLLLDAVSKQYVNGRLDLDDDVFFSADVDAVGRQWTGTCPACRAPVQVTLAASEPGVCPYCRSSLGVVG